MKRRHLIRYTGAGLLAVVGSNWLAGQQTSQAQTAGLTVKYLGHTCFLFTGGGVRVLVNPFRPLGCTAGYRSPQVETDVLLISSQLLDEGAADEVPGRPEILFRTGEYVFGNTRFEGIGIAHDRNGGRRFGTNVAWMWQQGGIKILHMGGAAAPVDIEQKILIGRPDIAFVPVGGGVKAYNPQEALQAINSLNPKIVIPTQYRTSAADENACDIVSVEEFLQLTTGVSVQRLGGDTITIRPGDLPQEGPVIRVLNYNF